MFAVVSCEENSNDDHILTHEQMVAYLIDLHLTEAKIQNLRIPRDSATHLFMLYKPKLLEAHHFEDTVLVISYNYYLRHPKEMEEIYTSVVDSLTLRLTLSK